MRTQPDPDTAYEVELTGPTTIHTYRHGSELLALLQAAVATEPSDPRSAVPEFGSDEKVVVRQLRRSLNT